MFVGNVNWVKLTCGFIQDLLTAQELPLGYGSADLVNLEERLRTKVFDGPGSLEIKGDVVVLLDSLVGGPWEERARALFQTLKNGEMAQLAGQTRRFARSPFATGIVPEEFFQAGERVIQAHETLPFIFKSLFKYAKWHSKGENVTVFFQKALQYLEEVGVEKTRGNDWLLRIAFHSYGWEWPENSNKPPPDKKLLFLARLAYFKQAEANVNVQVYRWIRRATWPTFYFSPLFRQEVQNYLENGGIEKSRAERLMDAALKYRYPEGPRKRIGSKVPPKPRPKEPTRPVEIPNVYDNSSVQAAITKLQMVMDTGFEKAFHSLIVEVVMQAFGGKRLPFHKPIGKIPPQTLQASLRLFIESELWPKINGSHIGQFHENLKLLLTQTGFPEDQVAEWVERLIFVRNRWHRPQNPDSLGTEENLLFEVRKIIAKKYNGQLSGVLLFQKWAMGGHWPDSPFFQLQLYEEIETFLVQEGTSSEDALAWIAYLIKERGDKPLFKTAGAK
ncbi:MAG: hypothetical protein A2W61_00100 [Deltaproteobacteria bacterium RIFCSPLOWO2_01_44_7]|nr:MAG: hypothetical protein A2712_00860 [Deltaproteobacteria bacterium RIFCSPHIGHO2_01_FULL_43_49]OGQ15308.1 MAG: hypothetical protein A3D22_04615 [Deltaproteobacteria bacterium RIFCSPHIGHO2_02_FULL_44_53]OGQ27068.1 MAG: hypothetical protein A3D98_01450 [Deltaproteobacteria bacterium RIFCSPHIGHO2_12_FULL_44_21]OGQ31824.1 MAG: hypothetical protein A2979_05775 [Deltaproteobacteria bacterium RIFCSPLOWO2_01_FULL_45_74]OGQ37638.1 MAG: hypothetical protein A2W61_00100 [Deltaproteobacteria bacterium 